MMTVLRMVETGFLILALATVLSSTLAVGTQVPVDTCSAEDMELIAAQRENQKFIIDFIVPILFPGAPFADNNVPLFAVYEKFAERANRTISDSGFIKFVEAVNEITAAYTESCIVSENSRTHLGEFAQMVQEFGKAYELRKMVKIHDLYGKMVYIDDQIRKNNVFEREKRATDVCKLSECRCPAGGMANVSCPCEFFNCLDMNNQLEPIFIGFQNFECLAFVVDTTGSMKDEIDYTVQVIKDFVASEDELGCYMLVPFNDKDSDPDESVGPVTLALENYVKDLKDFVTNLESAFQPESGGDCPEYSYHGVMKALDSLVDDFDISEFGSQIIVLTDAPSKGDVTSEDIISYASSIEVCVHFFLAENTYNCFEDFPGSVEEYNRIASETGGTVVDTKFDFSNFVQAYRNTPCQFLDNTYRRRKRAVIEEENCRSFQVSTLSSLLKLTIRTTSRAVTIRKPDGSLTNITNDNSPSEHRALHFSEKKPLAGVWTLCVEEGGELEISPEILVSMDVTPLYFAQDVDGTTSLTCAAPPGCTNTKFALYSSQSESIYSASVQLLGSSGGNAVEATLGKCNSSWIGNVATPTLGNYTYQVEGEDTNSNRFSYFTRKKVSFHSGEKNYRFVGTDVDDVSVEMGYPIVLSFTLTSNNPYGSSMFQFAVGRLDGFAVSMVAPMHRVIAYGESVEVDITLRVVSSRVKPGTTYTAIATATNGCATLSAAKGFTLTTPPTTAPPPDRCNPTCENGGTCVVIRRRSREFVRCRCPRGFIGRACERLRG